MVIGLRILHISDIHCSTRRALKVLDKEKYDLVVLSGDVECVDTAEEIVARAPLLVAVTGNMDDAAVAKYLRDKGVLLDGRVRRIDEPMFAGLGGLDFASSLSNLRRLLEREPVDIDILVSHHPPKGILDRTFIGLRIGLKELRKLVEDLKPKAHLFGHIHEARGVEVRNGIVFVNAGPLKKGYYAIVECNDRCTAELMRLEE